MMFAVPGWSVPLESLRTQVPEISNSTTKVSPPSALSGPEFGSKDGRKRKRSSGVSKAPEVNPANFPELWQAVIEKGSQGNLNLGIAYAKKKPKVAGKVEGRNPVLEGTTGDHGNLEVYKNNRRTKDDIRRTKVPLVFSDDFARNGATQSDSPSVKEPVPKLTPLQHSMRKKLISARFRYLNQTLYTTPSTRSLALFQENPEMFQEYHEGFRRQVEVWPENPLDGYLALIRHRGVERSGARHKNKKPTNDEEGRQGTEALPLPRTNGICYIADLGCGDAGLSKGLEGIKKKLNLQVFSYDLQSPSPLITRADIADLPLEDGSIDVAIFCLALMGTNWIDFIEEAFRILRWKGELWIAEIKSRFGRVPSHIRRVNHSVGNRKISQDLKAKKNEIDTDNADVVIEVDSHENNEGETDVSAFVEVLRKRGFILQGAKAVDLNNRMFVKMNFVKGQTPIKGKCVPVPKGMVGTWKKNPKVKFLDKEEALLSSEAIVLKPCVYKLR